ncbi:Signal recognition particle 9 kDa protein [Citrus sinensis]|uniref:Signal recognition particle 9 kDa protein n=1 Tax=Citrus sinensis TaxID=2711 RepID=A0ACB8MID0_CITSI|nr:Signal recognition particle 9 kDa protein [Citrus sinensis]
MVYVTSWDEFVGRSVQLYKADPQSTRYCMKYRHCDGKLVLKVTDNKEMQRFSFIISSDVQLLFKSVISLLLAFCLGLLIWEECLKFKTDQAQDAKKMEKLNNIFFALMARGPDVDLSEVTGKEQMEAQPAKKGRGRKQHSDILQTAGREAEVLFSFGLLQKFCGVGKHDPMMLLSLPPSIRLHKK